jgi:Response regulator receiver domain
MLKMRLELLGDFEVISADDGAKGCEMAAVEQPDIILMDLEMPVVDGWEATRRLKSSPTTHDIPSSRSPHMRWLGSAKRRSPRVATSSTPSRSSSIGWSRRCGAFSRFASDLHCGAIEALKQVCSSPRPLNQQKSERFRSPLSTWRAAGAILPPARTTTGGLSRSRLPLHEPTTARRVCWRREGSDPGRECVPSCNAWERKFCARHCN